LKIFSREFSVVVAFSILSVYFYFLMEWIFFATKPSFMSSLALPEKISALVIPPGLFSIAFICAIALLRLVGGVIESTLGFNIFSRTAPLLPALPLAACLFILVDNFTYTLIHYGVISTDGLPRFLYGVWFLFLLLVTYLFFHRKAKAPASSASRRGLTALAGILLLISAVDAVRALASNTRAPGMAITARTNLDRLPNILLVSSDGVDASNVSVYGYERDTTPFLRAKMKDALVFENAFTNAPTTRASQASMFTSKHSTTTRLFNMPGILQGEHAYQHLPGILRNLGYQSMDITFQFVSGSFDFNLRNSFDVSDSRAIQWKKFSFPGPFSIVFANAEYMIGEVVDRIRDRVLHIFFVQRMIDEFEELTLAKKKYTGDSPDGPRLNALLEFIETASEPFLVHVHFMGTHGGKFEIDHPQFSQGQEQTEKWMEDFYDDSILQFDGYVAEMFRRLEQVGKLDSSIIVIKTDHAQGAGSRRTETRLPLLIFFPNHDPKGRVKSNVQLLDLAPTILDYLRVDKPDWMEGESVLREEPDRLRRIVSVFATGRGNGPPGIYTVQVVVCNRVYNMLFPSQDVRHRPVKGHTNSCSDLELPDRDEIRQFVLEHLRSRGIDLSRDVKQAK
jgi:glucan phosphoethanolaminetransferase (alkaline phosphatase superfamily)